MSILIASSRGETKNLEAYLTDKLETEVLTIHLKEELNLSYLNSKKFEKIFFVHWSYLIPEEIFNTFECIVFHMTDLPFGRGGSPLQNLISRGIVETKLSALKCVKELDAGPIYLKEDLCLNGNAEEIFIRARAIMKDMIVRIVKNRIAPVDQSGEVVTFKRRKPEESNISSIFTLENLHNHIRMLDADGYPSAFLETDFFRIEFTRSSLKSGELIVDARIKLKERS